MSIGSVGVAIAATAMALACNVPAALAAVPANDRWGDAVTIASLPFQTTVDTSEATVSAGDPDCAASAHTAWYRFTPAVSGSYTFDVNGLWDSGGPALGVFSGRRRSATQLACDQALGGEEFAGVAADRVMLTAGVRYHVMVGSPAGGVGGNLFVRAVRYVAPSAKVHVAAGSVDPDTGAVTLTGTVDCRGTYAYGAFDGFPDIAVTARQLRPTWLARGSAGTWPEAGCETAAAWSVTVPSATGHAYVPGPAAVTARGYECNLWECVTRTTKARVVLTAGG